MIQKQQGCRRLDISSQTASEETSGGEQCSCPAYRRVRARERLEHPIRQPMHPLHRNGFSTSPLEPLLRSAKRNRDDEAACHQLSLS